MTEILKYHNLGNNIILKKGDKAYNKNKREQVENPHTVVGFVNTSLGSLAILERPFIKEYTSEPCAEVEKYYGTIRDCSKGNEYENDLGIESSSNMEADAEEVR